MSIANRNPRFNELVTLGNVHYPHFRSGLKQDTTEAGLRSPIFPVVFSQSPGQHGHPRIAFVLGTAYTVCLRKNS